MQRKKRPRVELFVENEYRYFLKVADLRARFYVQDDGSVERAVLISTVSEVGRKKSQSIKFAEA